MSGTYPNDSLARKREGRDQREGKKITFSGMHAHRGEDLRGGSGEENRKPYPHFESTAEIGKDAIHPARKEQIDERRERDVNKNKDLAAL
eukprot:14150938-Heterocapsa_arctica.AAC.1